MKCSHCGIEITNPELFILHEQNCLDEQKLNGLIKEEKDENPLEKLTVKELKELAKGRGLEGYTDLKKEELVAALSE